MALEFVSPPKRPRRVFQPKSPKSLTRAHVEEQLRRKSELEAEHIVLKEKLRRALSTPESFAGPEDEGMFKFFTGLT